VSGNSGVSGGGSCPDLLLLLLLPLLLLLQQCCYCSSHGCSAAFLQLVRLLVCSQGNCFLILQLPLEFVEKPERFRK